MIVTIKRIKEIIQEELQKIVQEGWKKKKYKKNDYKKYNKLVKRGKSVMVQTAYGDEFAWEDGSSYGVFASEEDGREIELDHNDIDVVLYEGRYRLSPQKDLEIHSWGTIAQVFGKKALNTDRLSRTVGFNRLAEKDLNQLTSVDKTYLEAYLRGINSWLNNNKLPIEFILTGISPQPWSLLDILSYKEFIIKIIDKKLNEETQICLDKNMINYPIHINRICNNFCNNEGLSNISPLYIIEENKKLKDKLFISKGFHNNKSHHD